MANEEERFVKLEPSTIDASVALKDLFLADLERLEESIWRNEEIGEKRFNFFVTFATAVGGGLVVLWTSDRSTTDTFRAALTKATSVALVTLLVFGLVSYRRMMHRDSVTEEYKREIRMIRRKYRDVFQAECLELKDYKLEREIKSEIAEHESNLKHRWKRIKQMGYTQTLATINGILLATVLIWANVSMTLALLSGLALGALLCFHGAKRHKQVK
jgi:hypothetical protein